jgi:hypothetical protein
VTQNPEAAPGASGDVLDLDIIALKAVLLNLRAARTIIGRDAILRREGGRVDNIIRRRPELLRTWLLRLDEVNRKFQQTANLWGQQ